MKLVCQHRGNSMQAMPVQSIGVKAWMIRIICIACYPTTSPIPCAKCAVHMIQTILPLQLHKDTLLLQHTSQCLSWTKCAKAISFHPYRLPTSLKEWSKFVPVTDRMVSMWWITNNGSSWMEYGKCAILSAMYNNKSNFVPWKVKIIRKMHVGWVKSCSHCTIIVNDLYPKPCHEQIKYYDRWMRELIPSSIALLLTLMF